MRKIKVIIDKNIPYIKDFLTEEIAPLFVSGEKMSNKTLKDADAIIIRTVTKCNAALLENTKVRLIVTATIGDDHIDREYCKEKGIEVRTAEACNSNAVVQYVLMSLFYLENKFGYAWREKTIGIIGVGNIGGSLNKVLQCMQVKTLLCDPPRAETEENTTFVNLLEIKEKADIISIHTPLIKTGKHKTVNLLDDSFFSTLTKEIVLINSSRGPVLSGTTIKKWKKTGIIKHLILDVWENEANIDLELLNLTELSTPHIAGYSLRGKITATYLSLQHLNTFFQIKNTSLKSIFSIIPSTVINHTFSFSKSENENLWVILQQVWEIEKDSNKLRTEPQDFQDLRAKYHYRNEFRDVDFFNNQRKTKLHTSFKCLSI